MSTPILTPEVRDTAMTQVLGTSTVPAVFPVVTLSGGSPQRFKTAVTTKATTPANAQIVDENGDLLCVCFALQNPLQFMFTQKGLARREAELSDQTR